MAAADAVVVPPQEESVGAPPPLPERGTAGGGEPVPPLPRKSASRLKRILFCGAAPPKFARSKWYTQLCVAAGLLAFTAAEGAFLGCVAFIAGGNLDLNGQQVALLMAAAHVTMLPTALLVPLVADPFASRLIPVFISLLFLAGSNFLVGSFQSSSYGMLVLARLLQGVGAGIAWDMVVPSLGDANAADEAFFKAVSRTLLAGTAGFLLGPPCGAALFQVAGWASPFFICFAFSILCALAWAVLDLEGAAEELTKAALESGPSTAPEGTVTERRPLFPSAAGEPVDTPAFADDVVQLTAPQVERPSIARLLSIGPHVAPLHPRFRPDQAILLGLAPESTSSSTYIWIATSCVETLLFAGILATFPYRLTDFGASPASAGGLLFTLLGADALVSVLLVRLSPGPLVRRYLPWIAFSCLGLFSPMLYAVTPEAGIGWTVPPLLGFAVLEACFRVPAHLEIAQGVAGSNAVPRIFGIYMTLSAVGAIAGPPLCAWLIDIRTPAQGIGIVGGCVCAWGVVVGFVLLGLDLARREGRVLPGTEAGTVVEEAKSERRAGWKLQRRDTGRTF
ncbi:major facilitator superfamily domain-containing protein [Hyaloraphidium curvatum]|nr:major facilitator superfamily domain-containing protein [Hyaloraphidium curvatum]